jgi:hypothetical protein
MLSMLSHRYRSWLHSLVGCNWEIGDLIRFGIVCPVLILTRYKTPLAGHYTNGTPSMAGHENDPYAVSGTRSKKYTIMHIIGVLGVARLCY